MRYVTAALFAVAFLIGVTAEPMGDPTISDLEADKYLALAAWDGTGAHRPLPELGAVYGLDVPDHWVYPAARTPGGLLVASPAILVPDPWLPVVAQVASVAALLAVCYLAARIGRFPAWAGGVAAVVLARQPVMLDQYSWGNSGMWVAVLVVAAWFLLPSKWAGVLVGVAAVVKAWPAVLILVLLYGRETRRAGWWAAGSAAGLTSAGLLLPGSSIGGAVSAVLGGSGFAAFPSNMSAAGLWDLPVWAGMLVGLAVVAVGLRLDVDWRMTAAVVGGLLASPITWPRYWLAAVPVVFVVAREAVTVRAERRETVAV
jgi:alpha-1,2-mannosyltransferase